MILGKASALVTFRERKHSSSFCWANAKIHSMFRIFWLFIAGDLCYNITNIFDIWVVKGFAHSGELTQATPSLATGDRVSERPISASGIRGGHHGGGRGV